jgi:hypothetical protein
MYKIPFIKSWKNIQPILFVPDLILAVYTLFIGILLFNYIGFNDLINTQILTQDAESLFPVLYQFFISHYWKIIVSLLVFVVSHFIFGAGIYAMRFSLLFDVIKKRKNLSIKTMYIGAAKNFSRVVLMKIYVFILGLVIVIGLIALTYALSFVIDNTNVIWGIALALLLLIIIFFKLALFFRYQVMFLYNYRPLKAMKKCLKYFIKNTDKVVIIWLIIASLGFIIIPLDLLMGLSLVPLHYEFSFIVMVIFARILLDIILNVWSEFFKFNFLND